jgi:hypothetical protein
VVLLFAESWTKDPVYGFVTKVFFKSETAEGAALLSTASFLPPVPFLPSFTLPSFLPSFLSPFLPSLPTCLPACLIAFLPPFPSFLQFTFPFLPSSLPSFMQSFFHRFP